MKNGTKVFVTHRKYNNFEILDSFTIIFVFRLVDEEYCVVKRLYCSLSAMSNNFGAQATASALPLTVQIFELSSGPLTEVRTQSII